MKVLCAYEIEKDKKCDKVVYDDGKDDEIIMRSHCLEHRYDYSYEEILEVIESLGIVDRVLLAEKTNSSLAFASIRLDKLHRHGELAMGAAINRSRKRTHAVLVYTLPDRAKDFHNTSTERYESINMDIKHELIRD